MMVGYSIEELFRQHRRTYLAILLIPALAIVIALIVIAIRGSSNFIFKMTVISLVLIQYLGLVVYIWRRLISLK